MPELPLRLPDSNRDAGPKNTRPARMVTISMTMPKLVFSLLFMAGILVWVFIFGIMLGRGHKPEKIVPELAKVMPAPQPKSVVAQPPVQNATQTASAKNTMPAATSKNATAVPVPAKSPAAPQTTASAAQPQVPAGILSPQELQYHETLKGRPTASPVPPAAPRPVPDVKKTGLKTSPNLQAAQEKKRTAQKTEAKSASAKPQPAKPEAKNIAAKPQTPAKPEPKPAAAKPDPKAASMKKTGEPVYNYVYQVAAFKDMPSTESMRKKLQAAGIATRVEKSAEGGTTWYKLLTPFRGRPEDTRALKNALAGQGLPRVILRSKTPAQ